MNPRAALGNLVTAYTTLAAAGMRPFLVDGTLLGAVRDGRFMAHDRDTDMGLFIGEADPPRVVAAMQRAGFRLRRVFGSPSLGLELSFRRHGIKLDLFFYYTDGQGHYHAAWKNDTPIRYRYWPFALASFRFLGHDFLAPDDPVRFCRTKYGVDWQTPVTVWDWAWGPKNAEAWVTA